MKTISLFKTFDSAYDAGFDCGLHGADNFNSHYRWFVTAEKMKEWERGKRSAEELLDITNKNKKHLE